MENREYPRKLLDPIHVTDIQVIDRYIFVARYGTVVNASATGLLIEIQPKDLNPELQEEKLTIEAFQGDDVMMRVVEMSLEIDGKIVRTQKTSHGSYEIGIDFAANAPAYWRECFAELLPQQGELNRIQHAHLN